MANASSLARTPLFEVIAASGARMVGFSGWEMPVQFSSISQEHQAVRQGAGLFDISHMGKFKLRGHQLRQQLQVLVPSDLQRLQPGMAQYTLLLNHEGGILDDLIVYFQGYTRTDQEAIVIIVNAATRAHDQAWMLSHLDADAVTFEDCSSSHVLIALQGPKAATLLQPLVTTDLAAIPAFGHVESRLLDQPAFLARTGYTGEDGFEVMLPVPDAQTLWSTLIEQGFVPCGLGARDTLRLEAAMCLYGQDISATTSPLEAGLGWVVHLEKGNFIGRDALLAQKQTGIRRKLVGLKMQSRHIARHDYPVIHEGEVVGHVTSGTLSPTLGYPIALAYVPAPLAQLGQTLMVEIREKTYGATVVKRPFYKRSRP